MMLEIKSKSIILSSILYVFSTVFICYLSFKQVELSIWNALIWVILLFILTNSSNRIFFYESTKQKIYLYSLAGSGSVIISKLIYQWFISGILSLLVLFVWSLLFNRSIPHPLNFILVLILGVWAMSNVLTLNNALASSTNNSPAVLAILSFPVIIPILLSTIEGSSLALQATSSPQLGIFILVLSLLNILTLTLSIILFQYLWRY